MATYPYARIYAITSDHTHMVYIGSSRQRYLCNRWAHHTEDWRAQRPFRSRSSALFDLVGGPEHCRIQVLEVYPCDTLLQLRERERFWMDTYTGRTLNKYRPCITQEERLQQKRESYRRCRLEKSRSIVNDTTASD